MYFKNRAEAGNLLAEGVKLGLPNLNTCVIALSEGASLIGEEIASVIHSSLFFLAVEEIKLPGELNAFTGMSQGGVMTYNQGRYSTSDIKELAGEYDGFLQGARIQKFRDLNINSVDTEIMSSMLDRHIVILVSDGIDDPFTLQMAVDFLKPRSIHSLLVATPLASVRAVDAIHLMADRIICLSVVENYVNTNHYYDENEMPTREQLVEKIKTISLKWRIAK